MRGEITSQIALEFGVNFIAISKSKHYWIIENRIFTANRVFPVPDRYPSGFLHYRKTEIDVLRYRKKLESDFSEKPIRG